MRNKRAIVFAFFLLVTMAVVAREVPFTWSTPDTLVVNDGVSKQCYLWKDGLLTLVRTTLLSDHRVVNFFANQTDRVSEGIPVETNWEITRHPDTERTAGYYQLELHSNHEEQEVLRTLRKYDEVPGIEWGMAVRGSTSAFEMPGTGGAGGIDLVEDPSLLTGSMPHYFFLPFSTPHHTVSIVSFREATDHHTNIAHRHDVLPYRKSVYYRGSVLLATNNQTGDVHLIVKKSPLERAQAYYAGFDFSTDFSGVKVHSPGVTSSPEMDSAFDEKKENGNGEAGWNEAPWQEAYSLFVLLHADNEDTALEAYKLHDLATHRYLPHLDNTFTMNTWGDRNRDSRVNEQFILTELAVAARLGITHYQIDDGWQQGLSRNSAAKAGALWDDWDASDWKVNTTRFPNGLTKVKEEAGRLGIDLGLWFNPSKANHYAMWKQDQEILMGLHEQHGVSWIKIDGLEIGDKLSEDRVGAMLGGAKQASDGKLQFNMDVTAGHRGGYFFFNHFGNTFLENRYTDWGNYYPHLTLRNAWTLANYVPIQRFQIEWLNKWRNDNQYPENDPLKPANVPFDYQFAIAMMGQPLAWMEATGLPEEAFEVVPLVEEWKKVRDEMQRGVIVPVGQEPNGYSFPGFVSYGEKKVFVLLFRENAFPSSASCNVPESNPSNNDSINNTLLNNYFSGNDSTLSTSNAVAKGVYLLPRGEVTGKRFVPIAGEGTLLGNNADCLVVEFQKPYQFLLGYFE